MTEPLAALAALLRDRDALRRPHAEIWPAISRHGPAMAERWADVTLALSRVNAGPACIIAFWRAAVRADPALVLCGGAEAAALCRLAGATAALACLEALPAAIRLTRADADGMAAWWRGLHHLAHAAPGLVPDVARRTEAMLANGSGAGFADFVAAGLKATAADKAARAAYFRLDDPAGRSLLARRPGDQGFAECERMLGAFAAGLWGGAPRMAAGPGGVRRTMIASGSVLLPAAFGGAPACATRDLYRAAAAHALAHLAVPAVRHALGQLKPLQLATIGMVEDARVEALAIRRHPGLRRLWSRFHGAQPGGVQTAASLMARLARALLDPEYADDDGFVGKGKALFQAEAERLEDPSVSRRIGGLLGNDLGQMRVQFNAREYLVEPAYRDDNMHLWEFPEAPDDALALMVETARAQPEDGGGQAGAGSGAAPARDAGVDDEALVLARYPEWDMAARRERPDWTALRDATPALRDPGPGWPGDAALRARLVRLVRSSAAGMAVRQRRQMDGTTLDLDAAIDAIVAQRGLREPDGRPYRERRVRGRDLSTVIILDVSQSTAARDAAGRSVLETQRLAVAALAPALEVLGDRFAVRAFASAGREDVRLTRIKDFDERLAPVTARRLAGLSPGLSTRLGAALRHAGAELAPLRTARKLVLVLTDGEPSDIDVPDPRELVEDARRAVLALRLRGVDAFGLVMDPQAAGSGATIFGRHNTLPVRRPEDFPARLSDVYFRLAQR